MSARNGERKMRAIKPKRNPKPEKRRRNENENHQMVYNNIWAINKEKEKEHFECAREKKAKSNFHIVPRIHFNKQHNLHLCLALYSKPTQTNSTLIRKCWPFIISHFPWSGFLSLSCFVKRKIELEWMKPVRMCTIHSVKSAATSQKPFVFVSFCVQQTNTHTGKWKT